MIEFPFYSEVRKIKTTAKDVILLCKGWYNHDLYPTILEALKQYYRKNYSMDMEEYLNEIFLFRVILLDVMREITEKYPDRLKGFVNGYLDNVETIFGISDKSNNDYGYQMFYRIINFLSRLRMKGDGVVEIDTSEYFVDDLQTQHDQITREHLTFHDRKKCLIEDII